MWKPKLYKWTFIRVESKEYFATSLVVENLHTAHKSPYTDTSARIPVHNEIEMNCRRDHHIEFPYRIYMRMAYSINEEDFTLDWICEIGQQKNIHLFGQRLGEWHPRHTPSTLTHKIKIERLVAVLLYPPHSIFCTDSNPVANKLWKNSIMYLPT